jgi:hypothetical protein
LVRGELFRIECALDGRIQKYCARRWNKIRAFAVNDVKQGPFAENGFAMRREQKSRRSRCELEVRESTGPIEGWLRSELRNLHSEILDESLPAPIQELLTQLEARLQSADGQELAPPRAAEAGADRTDPTDEDK